MEKDLFLQRPRDESVLSFELEYKGYKYKENKKESSCDMIFLTIERALPLPVSYVFIAVTKTLKKTMGRSNIGARSWRGQSVTKIWPGSTLPERHRAIIWKGLWVLSGLCPPARSLLLGNMASQSHATTQKTIGNDLAESFSDSSQVLFISRRIFTVLLFCDLH